MINKPGTRFDAIQYLRAVAALMVVLFHAQNPGSFNPLKDYPATAWGVDIFFVISGFIMYAVARKESPKEFLVRRIIRIVPLYWAATLTLLLIEKKSSILFMSDELVIHILMSLAFIPHYNLANPEYAWPYLVPGWTLSYEIFFYILFFIALFTNKVLLTLVLIIVTLVAVGQLHVFNISTPVEILFVNPINLEFLIGVLIASAYMKYGIRASLAWLLPAGFICLMSLPFVNTFIPEVWWKIIFSSMIVVGAVAIGDRAPQSRLWNLLGDASYSIYLTHTIFPLDLAESILKLLPLSGIPQFIVWTVLSLGLCIIIGVLVYLFIEKPVLNWLRQKWKMIGRVRKPREREEPTISRL